MCKNCASVAVKHVEKLRSFFPTTRTERAQNVCDGSMAVNNDRVLPSFFPQVSSIQTTAKNSQAHLLKSGFAQYPQGLLLSLLFI